MNSKLSQSQGFTLIEVLVALVIIAVALGGAVKVMGSAASNASIMSQKTFAQWVGLNQLTQAKLDGVWLKPGESKGDAEMVHQKWRWVQKVSTTEVDDVNRVEVSVYKASADKDVQPLAHVVGFLTKP